MEVENQHDALILLNVLETFLVSLINNQGPLDIRKTPMTRNVYSLGTDETDGLHLNVRISFCPPGSALVNAIRLVSNPTSLAWAKPH